MILRYDTATEVAIHSLSDLFILKRLEEVSNLKVNKSQLARELNVDRRTVDKYMNGYERKVTRDRGSKLDKYYDTVKALLESDSQVFFYKRVLWQYLTDNQGLVCPQSSFRRWISKHPEFQSYFNGKSNRTVNGEKRDFTTTHKHPLTYTTGPGYEAQIDYKEAMHFRLKDGSIAEINVLSMVFSYSRFKIFQMTLSKTQPVLFHLLDNAFSIAGGVPKTLRTDNMKTVMDIPRTVYSKGKINARFEQFAKDYGFEVKPCRSHEPEVKAKCEAPMKLMDELYAYNGQLDLIGLNDKLKEINDRVNSMCHSETGKIPILHFKKEKDSLSPLPHDSIRNPYKIESKTVKVNTQSLVVYKSRYYSVPPIYIGKELTVQAHDNNLHIYNNTKLVTIHEINQNKKRNYHEEHYIEIAKLAIDGNNSEIEEFAKNSLKEIGEYYK